MNPGTGGGGEGGSLWKHGLLAFLSLGLLSCAFHPVNQPWLAWLAFVPWMVHHQRKAPPGSVRVLCAAFYLHHVYMLMWVGEVAPPMVWVIPLMGIPFTASLAWLLDLGVHRLRLPPLWLYALGITAFDVLRQFLLHLTWVPVGHTAWWWTDLLQTASIFGVHGMTFAVVSVNGALAAGLSAVLERRGEPGSSPLRRPLLAASAGLLPAILLAALGAVLLARLELRPGPTVLGVQPNIPQEVKLRTRRIEVWKRLCRVWEEGGGADEDPDLLVLPETCFFSVSDPDRSLESLLELRDPRFPRGRLAGIFPRGRGQMTVVGYARFRKIPPDSRIVDEDGDGFQEWNVAGVVRDGRTLVAEYAKRILVPFGEFVPLPEWWPRREAFKEMILEQAGYVPDLTPGDRGVFPELKLADGRSYRFGLSICYEIVFPGVFREMAREGCDFAVNVSNDGWYHESNELDLVNIQTAFRAVECRRSVVRVSNTGISTVVDPAGRHLDTVEVDGRRKSVAGLLRARVPICAERTLYARFWLLPASVFILAFALLLAWGWGRSRRPPPAK